MEPIVEKTLLFDFYGELLTAHQQEVYENVVFNDMSLSEAAALYGVSRQGVHDLIRRTQKQMEEYESKLQLVAHHEEFMKLVPQAEKCLSEKTVDDTAREALEKLLEILKTEM